MGSAGLAPGMVLHDTYRVVRQIGEGGMGEVFEVAHARLAGNYAVKLLRAEIASNPEAFSRFRREAEITSALRHPNIVNVIDFNQLPDGRMYLVMELLDGVNLETRLAESGPMTLQQTVTFVEQVASALAAAHSRGVVHRDLKPQNIFLVRMEGQEKEIAKVVDFGISKVKAATKNLTRESAVMGTPQYMAPEQALGLIEQIDARTDQFALGAIAYEMLAGREAFRAESLPAIIYQVVHHEPPPLRDAAPGLPTEVDAVIRKAMRKSPAERYGSIIEFAAALEAVATHTPTPVAVGGEALAPAARSSTLLTGVAPSPRAAPKAEAPEKITTFTSTASELRRGPTPRSRFIVVAAGTGALLAVGAGLFVSRGRAPTPGRPVSAATIAPPEPARPAIVVIPAPAPTATASPVPAASDGKKNVDPPRAGGKDRGPVRAKGRGFAKIKL